VSASSWWLVQLSDGFDINVKTAVMANEVKQSMHREAVDCRFSSQ